MQIRQQERIKKHLFEVDEEVPRRSLPQFTKGFLSKQLPTRMRDYSLQELSDWAGSNTFRASRQADHEWQELPSKREPKMIESRSEQKPLSSRQSGMETATNFLNPINIKFRSDRVKEYRHRKTSSPGKKPKRNPEKREDSLIFPQYKKEPLKHERQISILTMLRTKQFVRRRRHIQMPTDMQGFQAIGLFN